MNETDKAEVTRKKIVLVDDLKFHLLSTKERLKDSYEVYTAQSADILFEILSKTPIDLILLDINMPDVDGYKVITQLKSTPRLKEIPVVFLSAKADKESVAKGLSLGAVDYVIKPFTDAALVDCIERQLNPKAKVHEKPIVLAVDDNPSILQSINHALDAQFKVYTLPQPEILEELLERLTPDLFLLDYLMPKMTGFDLVPIIRKFPEHDETPIIFLTSEGSTDHVTAAINLGACDFIVKPIKESVLCQKAMMNTIDYMTLRRKRMIFKEAKRF